MARYTFMLLLLCFALGAANGQGRLKKKIILPKALNEVSGLYYAGPDSLWWLNDSGNSAALYLTDGRGKLKQVLQVPGALNRDWEDLTGDDKGKLYIGDFGNNLNRRQDLCIYIFQPQTGQLDSIRFRYPDQRTYPPAPEYWNFDMEGFFWSQDSLHLFSKNRLPQGNYYSKHYVLPAAAGQYTASLKDSLLLKNRVVTSAAQSPDGASMALLAYWYKLFLGFIPVTKTSIFLFSDYPGSDFLKGKIKRYRVPHCIAPTQYESIDFIAPGKVRVASEKTVLFRQQARVRKVGGG